MENNYETLRMPELKALARERKLTLSGPAFSVVRQARGGSEARMAKIKVNINLLK